MRRIGLAAIAALALGCSVDPYCLSCPDDSDGGVVGDGATGDGATFDAGTNDAGACVPGAPERCNMRDDNCNGQVDEGIDFNTSLDDCGGCNRPCAPVGAFGVCRDGMCHVDRCDVGHIDLDGLESTGCEYACLASFADDSICNMLDDDCDGMTDEDVVLASDPDNCGRCGNACTFANAVGACMASMCVIDGCLPDFYDLDGLPETGCEYACNGAGGAEVCNALDDDCDGTVDEDVTPPTGLCRTGGECAGAMAECMGTLGFRCAYGAGVEVDPATGQPVARETRCDGLDGNCNGALDESFRTLGNDCLSDGVGACRQPGTVVCSDDHTAAVCSASPSAPGTETCNGLDDDCDGSVDEPRSAPGTMPSFVTTQWIQYATNRWMMQYEASRPGAGAGSEGTLTGRACSASGVRPWTSLRYSDATAACTAAGARLCTETDFEDACHTASACTWAWQPSCTTFSTTACNTADLADPDVIHDTGSLAQCFANTSGGSIFDLSGNVKEFMQARPSGAIPLRGGSYNQGGFGATCDFDWQVVSGTFRFENVGFRCCFDGATPP